MAKLIVNPTSSSRREISLGRTLLSIGRDPSNDLVLPDAMVSRRHAVIEYRGSQYYLRDCNSSNGSVINGDRVSERSLRDGDLVAIGTARLLFRDEAELDDPASKVVQHPSSPRLQCQACQADYRKGDLYCRQCGSAIAASNAPPKAVCVSCGTVVPLPARFCNACGSRLPIEEKGEVTQPPPSAVAAEAGSPPGPVAASAAVSGGPVAPAAEPPAPPSAPPGSGSSEPAVIPPDPAPSSQGNAGPAAEPAPPGEAPKARLAALREEGALGPGPRSGRTPSGPLVSVAGSAARWPAIVRAERPLRDAADRRPHPLRVHASAGAGRRLAAGLADLLLVGAGQALLLAPAVYYWSSRQIPSFAGEGPLPLLPIAISAALLPLAVALGAVYYVYFWGTRGATPGKRLVGIAVEGEDDASPIGTSRALVRLLGYVLSAALLGAGFIMIAFGMTSLHDRIAGTRVVRRERS